MIYFIQSPTSVEWNAMEFVAVTALVMKILLVTALTYVWMENDAAFPVSYNNGLYLSGLGSI